MKHITKKVYQTNFLSVNLAVNPELSGDSEFMVFGRKATNYGAIIIPVTTEGKIVLTKEYRLGSDDDVIGVPKGAADFMGESLRDIAVRELKEEVGLTFDGFKETQIKIWPLPAFAEFYGEVVIATGCAFNTNQELEDGERIEVFKEVTRDELKAIVISGEVNDAESLCALQHYLLSTS